MCVCGYMRIYAECDSCNFEALQIEMLQATSRPFLANISIYLKLSQHIYVHSVKICQESVSVDSMDAKNGPKQEPQFVNT
jgi:hypothetical protein